MSKSPVLVAVLSSLTLASAARADIILRVPADRPTIQAAIDAAAGIPDPVHIKVAGGRYREWVRVRTLPAGEALVVTGGWNAAFDSRDPGRWPSTIDGRGKGPVVAVTGDHLRRFQMTSFTIVGGHERDGEAGPPAGGLFVSVGGTAEVRFDDLLVQGHRLRGGSRAGSAVLVSVGDDATVTLRTSVIRDNRLTGDYGAGAGMRATVRQTAFLNLERNEFVRNRVRATDSDGVAQAAGAKIDVYDEGHLSMGVNRFVENRVSAEGAARDGALAVSALGDASASLGRNVYLDNRTESEAGDATGIVRLAVSSSAPGDRATVSSRADVYRGNRLGEEHGRVVWINSRAGQVSLSDSLIVGSEGGAVQTRTQSGGQVVLTNLTIADNEGGALRVVPVAMGGTTHLSNSILHDNGTDAPDGAPVLTTNLIGVNPLFVDAAGGDYHLKPGSPAIDAGTNLPPPAGELGPTDLDNLDRVVGARVDIGAYEHRPVP